MGAEASKPTKLTLTRENLEYLGIFILDGAPVDGETIPESLPDWKPNETLRKARKHIWETDDEWDLQKLCSQIPNHVCWLRELLLDCDGLVPSWATKELQQHERDELPIAAISEDEDLVNLGLVEQFAAKQKWREIFRECRRAAKKACENVENNVSEDAWQYFMNAYIFKRPRDGRKSLLDA